MKTTAWVRVKFLKVDFISNQEMIHPPQIYQIRFLSIESPYHLNFHEYLHDDKLICADVALSSRQVLNSELHHFFTLFGCDNL